jgi:uncharacterized protein YkwD
MSQTPAGPASSSPATTPSGSPPASARPTGPKSSAPLSAEDQVLATINEARAGQGLPPLTRTRGLNASAAAHNRAMTSNGCGLQHQCPGEADLGQRESSAGAQWSTAGENIGAGGPVANASKPVADMAVGLTKAMLAEKPPNDGHRQNILSKNYHHVGIAVVRDASGSVYLTQDFSD